MQFFHSVESHFMSDFLRNFSILLNIKIYSQLFKKLLIFLKQIYIDIFAVFYYFLFLIYFLVKRMLFERGLEVKELDVFIVKTCTLQLPKRLAGNNTQGSDRGDNDCILACFHTVAYHKKVNIFCSQFLLLQCCFLLLRISQTSSILSCNHAVLQAPFSCHCCCSCLVRF